MKSFSKRMLSVFLSALTLSSVTPVALTASAADTDTSVTQTSGTENPIIKNSDFSKYATGALPVTLDMIDDEHIVDSVAEYREYLDGNDSDSLLPKKSKIQSSSKSSALPSAVDNSTNENAKYFPEVGYQGSLGSCVSWSTGYYQMTYTLNKARGVETTPENTISPMWVYNINNKGYDGGTFSNMNYKLFMKMGAATVADVPIQTTFSNPTNYLDWHAEGDIWEKALENIIVDYAYLTSSGLDNSQNAECLYPVEEGTPITSAKDSDLDLIKTALSNGEILSFGTYILGWDLKQILRTDLPEGVNFGDCIVYECSSYGGGHQMTLVGYNDDIWADINGNGEVDEGEMGAFKIVNSYGNGFANNGFCWVAYDALNSVSAVPGVTNSPKRHCIFEGVASMKASSEPQNSGIYLKYTLNSANRVETVITVTAKDAAGHVVGESQAAPFCIDGLTNMYTNEPYSYNGTQKAADGTMAFDLNNVVPGLTPEKFRSYTWSVNVEDQKNDSYSLKVKDLRIVDSNSGKEYDILSGSSFTLNNRSRTLEYKDSSLAAALDVTPTINFGLYEYADIKASVKGGKAPFQYKFEYMRYGGRTLISDYSSDSSVKYQFPTQGSYSIFVTVKDAEGNTATASEGLTVNQTYLINLNPDNSMGTVGDTIKFTPETINLASVMKPSNFIYTVTKDGNSQTIPAESDNSLSFTPNEVGRYSIKCEIVYDSKIIASKTINYTVRDNTDKITIYYNGYTNPYIHYQTGTGSWTSAPGYAMTKTDEVSGYTHKYVINLGNASYANVCFNDGRGNWDSRNGQNYRFEKGTYTYSNGIITPYNSQSYSGELSLAFNIAENQSLPTNQFIPLEAEAIGGKAPYEYKFTYSGAITNWTDTIVKDYSASSSTNLRIRSSGLYYICATVKDADGNTVTEKRKVNVQYPTIEFSADRTEFKAGETVNITVSAEKIFQGLTYRLKAVKDGKETILSSGPAVPSVSVEWTPDEGGTYKIEAELLYNGNVTWFSSNEYNVEGTNSGNKITIYYKGYENPYIHYQVGSGSWTNAPGFAMTRTDEVNGYTHKYVIDLGNDSYANVCFNDGRGNWDSRNGQNYRFEAGTYTYSNGNIIRK